MPGGGASPSPSSSRNAETPYMATLVLGAAGAAIGVGGVFWVMGAMIGAGSRMAWLLGHTPMPTFKPVTPEAGAAQPGVAGSRVASADSDVTDVEPKQN